jgi:hypothetical protein
VEDREPHNRQQKNNQESKMLVLLAITVSITRARERWDNLKN